ncbi:hypothetical protein ElyMa_006356200 [Elysia marginata]|uniref:Shugoshin C-terminal domain-containing protein n=1 Tax=Elysia marginata TaxID=1093978 RepID=A0AAV4HKG2_9GAST|nr:hypothetical protein ElyMa_006356200 [Elysia marginata]
MLMAKIKHLRTESTRRTIMAARKPKKARPTGVSGALMQEEIHRKEGGGGEEEDLKLRGGGVEVNNGEEIELSRNSHLRKSRNSISGTQILDGSIEEVNAEKDDLGKTREDCYEGEELPQRRRSYTTKKDLHSLPSVETVDSTGNNFTLRRKDVEKRRERNKEENSVTKSSQPRLKQRGKPKIKEVRPAQSTAV